MPEAQVLTAVDSNKRKVVAVPDEGAPPPKKSKMEMEGAKEEAPKMRAHQIFDSNDQRSWKRPPAQKFDPRRDAICLQNLDCDSITDFPNNWNNGPRRPTSGHVPVIRMYGVTEQGNSVMVYIHGAEPYFYVPVWPGFRPDQTAVFQRMLNEALGMEGRVKNVARYVTKVEACQRRSLWGYNKDAMKTYLKVFVAVPTLVSASKRILEGGLNLGDLGRRSFLTYETNIPFVLRFMVDHSIGGGDWVEIPKAKWGYRSKGKCTSHCQIEINANFDDLKVHKPVGKWMKLAPIRTVSFDIECAGRKNKFPEPEHDPVIQIANVLSVYGCSEPLHKNVFTLKGCKAINGARIVSSEDEREVLRAWKRFILESDPDIITGYNIINFDLPYILNRAETLGIKDFPYLGRIVRSRSTMKETTFNSKQYGNRETKDIKIHGRIQFDLLPVIRRDHKFSSYSLNNVSAIFLGQQKEDVHYSIISDLQNGTDTTRRRLAKYCLKDAYLPQQLMNKLMLLINYVEMARVTGVPLNFLLTRGQQIKVVSQILRKAKSQSYLMPNRGRQHSDEKFEGATVIEPKRGYYTDPIATLDFASLYPSIMMAHNLCYTTLIDVRVKNQMVEAKEIEEEDVTRTPIGKFFVKSNVQILHELLSARSNAKKLMKKEKNPFLKAVYNGRQLALKVSANSVYGFTGAQMIDQTKKYVEEHYTIANGCAHDAEVVYGDTDSVMIKFGVKTVKEAMDLGEKAAIEVTKTFVKPVKLEFEKVYYPYLLMNKKRYAGMYWTNPDHYDKMDCKGIETVRRDNCLMVRVLIQRCLELILVERDPDAALAHTKKMIADLLCNRLDISMLVITKSLGKAEYKVKMPHTELAKRLKKRDPANAPQMGDRVAYVITQGAKNAPAYIRAECPIYVLENGVPLDYNYYLNNQLKKPLTRIFEPILGSVSQLFQGRHTLKRKTGVFKGGKKGGGLLFKSAKKTERCMGCKSILSAGEEVVCERCRPKLGVLYMEQMSKFRKNEAIHSQAWTECQRCTGNLHTDILCSNRDCPIFYRRKKVQKDLSDIQDQLKRFQIFDF